MLKSLAFFLLLFGLQVHASVSRHPFSTPDHTGNAFGNPFPRLTGDERREFFVGNSFFRQNWVQAGSSTPARDGLGPTFNAVSCSACHLLDGRGIGLDQEGPTHVSLLFRFDGDGTDKYGGQLNPLALPGVPAEAASTVRFEKISGQFPDGENFELRQPLYAITDWLLGAPAKTMRVSPRVANQLIGLGLLEDIPADEILKRADPKDLNQDGISGRASLVLDLRSGQMVLGRFGWKAEQPTVEQQSAAALNGDMGLTSSLFAQENCPAPQLICQKMPAGGSPEVEDLVLARMRTYMRSLAVPTQRPLPNDHGEKIFQRIGCANCHQPSYTVEGVDIFPYTDLLLHDMGDGLADRNLNQAILPTEWRTPPLWGIGLIPTVNRHQNLMHDGRARGVQEAILWHDGEARAAKTAYTQLSADERRDLIQFINSL